MDNEIKITLDDFKPETKEPRNVQAHFLLTPSNAIKLKSLADAKGISKNDLLNKIIEDL